MHSKLQDPPTRSYFSYACLARALGLLIGLFSLLRFVLQVSQWLAVEAASQSAMRGFSSNARNLVQEVNGSWWVPTMALLNLIVWCLAAHVLFWKSEAIGEAIEGSKHRLS